MPRINPVSADQATGRSKELLDAVKAKLGMTPNLMTTMAQSPAVLQAYLQFNDSLATGDLSRKLRELIAVSVGESNSCHYCVSAHSAIGKGIGVSDRQTDAVIRFARSVVTNRGQVSDKDLASMRDAGFSDGDIAEVVAHVALNIFTNYFNLVADTDIDFPIAPELEGAAKNAA